FGGKKLFSLGEPCRWAVCRQGFFSLESSSRTQRSIERVATFEVEKAVSRTSPTKRRGKADMQKIREAMYVPLQQYQPMTVRQVFYQMVSQGVVDKKESEYKATVCRLLKDMRLSGEIEFGWIADNTRWMRKPKTYSSAEHALRRTLQHYRQ